MRTKKQIWLTDLEIEQLIVCLKRACNSGADLSYTTAIVGKLQLESFIKRLEKLRASVA